MNTTILVEYSDDKVDIDIKINNIEGPTPDVADDQRNIYVEKLPKKSIISNTKNTKSGRLITIFGQTKINSNGCCSDVLGNAKDKNGLIKQLGSGGSFVITEK